MIGFITIILFTLAVSLISTGFFLILYAKKKLDKASYLFEESQEKMRHVKRDIENEKKEASLRLKDELHKRRTEFEIENKKERLELDRIQAKINSKYEIIEKKEQRLEDLSQELQQKERNLLRIFS